MKLGNFEFEQMPAQLPSPLMLLWGLAMMIAIYRTNSHLNKVEAQLKSCAVLTAQSLALVPGLIEAHAGLTQTSNQLRNLKQSGGAQ